MNKQICAIKAFIPCKSSCKMVPIWKQPEDCRFTSCIPPWCPTKA